MMGDHNTTIINDADVTGYSVSSSGITGPLLSPLATLSSATLRGRGIFRVTALTLVFCMTVVYGLITPFMGLEASRLSLSVPAVGWVFAIEPLFMLVSSPVAGWCCSRIGCLALFLPALFLFLGSTVGFGLVPDLIPMESPTILTALLLTRSVQGVSVAFIDTTALAWLAIGLSDDSVRSLEYFESVTGFGFLAGPPLGGFLYYLGGFRFPLIVVSGVVVLLSLILLLAPLLVSHIKLNIYPVPGPSTPNGSMWYTLCSLGWVGSATLLVMSLTPLVFGFFDPTLPLYYHTHFGFPVEVIGVLIAAPALIYVVTSWYIRIRAQHIPKSAILSGGVVCTGVALPFTGPPYEWLGIYDVGTQRGVSVGALVATGCFVAAASVPSLSLVLEPLSIDDTRVAVINGLANGAFSFGAVVGPLLGSYMVDGWDFPHATTFFGAGVVVYGFVYSALAVLYYADCGRKSHHHRIHP